MNHDRPRLLLVNRDLNVGGGITYMENLARGFIPLGWDVYYQSIPGPMAGRLRESGAIVQYRGWGHSLQLPMVVRMLRKLRPDVVNSHSNSTTSAVAMACKLTGTKFIITTHNPLDDKKPKRQELMKKAFDVADAVVTMNDRNAKLYNNLMKVDWDRLMVSRLFIPWGDEFPTKPSETQLTYCSRLSSSKGKLAEAFLRAGLELQYPVTIIGNGRKKRMLQQIGGKFIGYSGEVGKLFRDATVVGGAGFVAIEALEAGCVPVGLGFKGCQGTVTPENIEWAAARNYGDTDPTTYPFTQEIVRDQIKIALEIAGSQGVKELREKAREIHSLDRVVPNLEQFYSRVINGEGFGDLSRDARNFS